MLEKHRRPVPDDWHQIAPKFSQWALMNRYSASSLTVKRWVLQTGVKLSTYEHNRPLPDNLETIAVGHTFKSLAGLLGRGDTQLRKMLSATHPALYAQLVENGRKAMLTAARPIPGDFRVSVRAGLTRSKLCDLYSCSETVLRRWLNIAGPEYIRMVNEAGAAAIVRNGRNSRQRYAHAPSKPQVGSEQVQAVTHVQQAMRYLQRYAPCYPRSVHHPILEGYLFRGIAMTGAEIIAEATKRGWNPDAWRQIGVAA